MSSGAELTPTGALFGLWAPAQRRVQLRIDERAPVRRFMIENALHWLEEFHPNGLRLDAASGGGVHLQLRQAPGRDPSRTPPLKPATVSTALTPKTCKTPALATKVLALAPYRSRSWLRSCKIGQSWRPGSPPSTPGPLHGLRAAQGGELARKEERAS
jgi:hypothetical protein